MVSISQKSSGHLKVEIYDSDTLVWRLRSSRPLNREQARKFISEEVQAYLEEFDKHGMGMFPTA